MLFKKANKSIELIDKFLNCVDQSLLLFKEGVKNYLYNNTENFNNDILQLANNEIESDKLRREIEKTLFVQSLMPQLRGDIMRLLEEMDNLIDQSKKNLFQFEVETPLIPAELIQDFVRLTQISVSAAESVIPAAKSYFTEPINVTEKIHRVYFYEKETDLLADIIRRKIFRELKDLRLSEKFHLRYFTLHIENISDTAEKVADLLSIMAIKRIV
jgi:predicted phosphate transport protein (TIGR00153 family)